MIKKPLFLAFLLAAGCSSGGMMTKKMDAPLVRAIEKIDISSMEMLDVFVRCSTSVTDVVKSQLEATGCTVKTVAGDIATVKATHRQIADLSKLDIVSALSLSGTSQPLNQ